MLAHDLDRNGHDRNAVLLHSLALDRSVWDGMRPQLAPRFDVVAVDLPGHGASPAPREATIHGMAREVGELLERLAISDALVVGLSLGGCVAQALAVGQPERVGALGLIDTTCWYGPTAEQDWEARAQQARERGLDSLAGFQLERWFTEAFRRREPGVCERMLEVFRRNDLDNYVASCRAMGAMDLREEVSAIEVPTAVVVGEHDPATPVSHAEDLRDRIPGARLTVLADCSHLSAVERPDAVLAAIENCLPVA